MAASASNVLGRQRPNLPPPNPALFNRRARYIRANQQTTSIANVTATSATQRLSPINLPAVGYHYRVYTWFDLLVTVGDITSARLRSNDTIANTNLRFPAPWGLIQNSEYSVSGNAPVWSMPGYENYLLQLAANRGRKPYFGLDVFGSSVTGSRGTGAKECQFALTTSSGTTPLLTKTFLDNDSALTDSTDIEAKFMLAHNLTLGESAVAGLIPVQDYRVTPQLKLEIGNTGDMFVNPTNTSLAGTAYTIVDYFEAPAGVRPDTRYVMQSRYQTDTMSGTGEKRFTPQLGGVLLRTFISLWHGSATSLSMYACNLEETVGTAGIRVQQNTYLDDSPNAFRAHDELRWYGKFLPSNVISFDHVASGFGDPGMPSLRDPIESGRLTKCEYFWNQNVLTTAGEWRAAFQQLLPMPQVNGA